MSNFNLNDFFAAFNSLKARGSARINSTNKSNSCGSCHQQDQKPAMPSQFECQDEDVQLSGWHCRHTPVETPKPTCQPQPTCQPKPTCHCQPQPTCQPEPTCNCQPQKPPCNKPQILQPTQNNANFGIIDGEGNDVYGMGNRGIIDTDGNDIYAKNYSINTFNTTNNFYNQTIKPDPTVEPTIDPPDDPTKEPTVDPPDDPTEEPKVNLMPLRSLLTGIDAIRTPDGVLSEKELERAMLNPTSADMDGDLTKISSEEMAIFNAIKEFNKDANLIANVIKGDYSNIDQATLNSLFELSEKIRALTKY